MHSPGSGLFSRAPRLAFLFINPVVLLLQFDGIRQRVPFHDLATLMAVIRDSDCQTSLMCAFLHQYLCQQMHQCPKDCKKKLFSLCRSCVSYMMQKLETLNLAGRVKEQLDYSCVLLENNTVMFCMCLSRSSSVPWFSSCICVFLPFGLRLSCLEAQFL